MTIKKGVKNHPLFGGRPFRTGLEPPGLCGYLGGPQEGPWGSSRIPYQGPKRVFPGVDLLRLGLGFEGFPGGTQSKIRGFPQNPPRFPPLSTGFRGYPPKQCFRG